MVAEGGDDDHLSTPRRHDIAANDIFRPVIPALEDNVRLQCGNEFTHTDFKLIDHIKQDFGKICVCLYYNLNHFI